MNLLSSTNSAPVNPSSLPPSPSTSSPSPAKATLLPESQMTIGMAFPSTAHKTRPMDPPPSDRITTNPSSKTVPLERPKNIKTEEGEMMRRERVSLADEKSALDIDRALKRENEEHTSWLGENSFKPTDGATTEQPKLEEVSTQLKSLVEFFKTITTTSSTLDSTVASLNALMGKKLDKGEEKSDIGSLEVLHQLGWQLIRLGRNTTTPPQPHAIPSSTCSSRTSQCMQQSLQSPSSPSVPPTLPAQSQKPPQRPKSPTHSILMRGNQKYSAFYQHSKKHQVMEELEAFRQFPTTSVQPFHHIGFPHRRLNGPTLPSHPKLEPPTKPSVMGQRSQSELASPPRNRETAFLCSCGDDFESLYGFTLHMRDTGHKPRSSQPERDIPKLVRGQDMWINSETEQTREILRCMRCNQSFRSLPELTMHMMKTSHYSEIVYSDAGRNLLASQTFSSGAERNRASGSTNVSSWNVAALKASSSSSSSLSIKRPIRSSAPLQNGSTVPSEPVKTVELSTAERKVNGHLEAHCTTAKPSRLEKSQTCERPASSHEMHALKPSPKPSASPEALSCPSELQRSDTSSPRNEGGKQEPKYLSSSISCLRASNDDPERWVCTDSVIRQIESFVEKSLPFSSSSSPPTSTPSPWQPRQQVQGLVKTPAFAHYNLSPLSKMDVCRSTQDKDVQRKRRYSSESSNSMAPYGTTTGTTLAETSAEKRPLLSGIFSEPVGSENPLSSLQKLVETTHQSGTGLKSPIRPFSRTSDISPSPSNHSNESGTPKTTETVPQQSNIAATLSAIQSLMSSTLVSSTNNSSHQAKASPNLDFLLPSNGRDDTANWMGLFSAFLAGTKQPEPDPQPQDNNQPPSNMPSTLNMLDQPPVVFPVGFDFSAVHPLSAHMKPPAMTSTGPGAVVNMNKKAKCHFCGKPFANKGQVRLHISKNKCPCLLQQSALAKPSSSNMGPQALDKRGLTFPYPGVGDFSRFFAPPLPSIGQTLGPPVPSVSPSAKQKSTGQTAPGEAASLSALLQHLSAPQTMRTVDVKSADLLHRPTGTSSGNTSTSTNSLFSVLFPSTNTAAPTPLPPPQRQPADTSGLTSEQKALFLFAQAMASLAVAAPNAAATMKSGEEANQPLPPSLPPQQPPAYPPFGSLLQNFNIAPTPSQETAADTEALGSYLNAIRHLASFGNSAFGTALAAAAAAAATAAAAASTTSMTDTNLPATTTSLLPPNSLVGAERLATTSKQTGS